MIMELRPTVRLGMWESSRMLATGATLLYLQHSGIDRMKMSRSRGWVHWVFTRTKSLVLVLEAVFSLLSSVLH